jgi:AcrR family transcriptional regulator
VNATEESEPRWRRRPTERPQEILQAALAAFAEQGLAGTRVEDIARRAGVSKGTVYLYFSGKEEIFKEAVLAKVARTVEGLTAAAAPGTPVERLDRFVDAYWVHVRRPQFASLYRLVMAELHQFPELTRFFGEQVSGRVIGIAADIIEEGVAAGQLRRVEPTVAARMLVGLMLQHAVWASRRTLYPHLGRRTDDQILNEIKDFLFGALLDPGAGAPERNA